MGGIYLTFPYTQLRDRIVSEAEKATGMEVTIEKVRLAGFSGLTLHGIDLGSFEVKAPPPVVEEGEEAPPPPAPERLHLDSLTAKADLIAFAMGKRGVRFDVDAFGGDITGKVVLGDDEQVLEAKARGIDFGQSPLQAVAGLDMVGRIASMDIALRSPGGDFSKADGTVEINGEELALNGGEVQMFELPQIALGALQGRIEFKEGVADIEDLTIKGADLDARMEGQLRLQPVLKNSSLTGKLRIKPSDDWWNRNEMLKTAANFALPAGKDGWRALTLYGQLRHPGFRPVK
jgi:type II secretion system protein N